MSVTIYLHGGGVGNLRVNLRLHSFIVDLKIWFAWQQNMPSMTRFDIPTNQSEYKSHYNYNWRAESQSGLTHETLFCNPLLANKMCFRIWKNWIFSFFFRGVMIFNAFLCHWSNSHSFLGHSGSPHFNKGRCLSGTYSMHWTLVIVEQCILWKCRALIVLNTVLFQR